MARRVDTLSWRRHREPRGPGTGTADQTAAPARNPAKLTVVMVDSFPPLCFRDEHGNPARLLADLWKLWSEKTGTPIDLVAASTGEAVKMVSEGRAQIHAGLAFNDERDKVLDYGQDLRAYRLGVFYHRTIARLNVP